MNRAFLFFSESKKSPTLQFSGVVAGICMVKRNSLSVFTGITRLLQLRFAELFKAFCVCQRVRTEERFGNLWGLFIVRTQKQRAADDQNREGMQVDVQFAQFAEVVLYMRPGMVLNNALDVFAQDVGLTGQYVLDEGIIKLLSVPGVD